MENNRVGRRREANFGVHSSRFTGDICLPISRSYRRGRQLEVVQLEELETLLARSRADERFKEDVRLLFTRGEAPRIRIDSYVPRVKVQRLLKQMLASEPDLPIDGVAVSGASGCSDFVGTLEARARSATHVFDFGWCCRWRAQQEGWTDYFGFPDQIRAAQEFDWRCFHTWRKRNTRDEGRGMRDA